MNKGRITFGMSDKKLRDRIAKLSQEERIRLLIMIALAWPELRKRRKENRK